MIKELKILLGFIFIVILVILVWSGISWYMISDTEVPGYALVQNAKGYEVRDYPPSTALEVVEKGTFNEAAQNGFNRLSAYFTEKNIPLTMPIRITTIGEKGDTHLVSFAIPEGTMVEKPATTTGIRMHTMSDQHLAVYTFTGFATDERVSEEKRTFLRLLTRDEVVILSDFIVAEYTPPFTIPFLMKNEIWVGI